MITNSQSWNQLCWYNSDNNNKNSNKVIHHNFFLLVLCVLLVLYVEIIFCRQKLVHQLWAIVLLLVPQMAQENSILFKVQKRPTSSGILSAILSANPHQSKSNVSILNPSYWTLELWVWTLHTTASISRHKYTSYVELSWLVLLQMTFPYAWQPNITPVQLLKVGQLIITALPGEFTTMSGRRMRDALAQVFLLSYQAFIDIMWTISRYYYHYSSDYQPPNTHVHVYEFIQPAIDVSCF